VTYFQNSVDIILAKTRYAFCLEVMFMFLFDTYALRNYGRKRSEFLNCKNKFTPKALKDAAKEKLTTTRKPLESVSSLAL